MSLFAAAQARATYKNRQHSVSSVTDPLQWFTEWLGGSKTAAGVDVDVDSALSLSTFFMGKSLISEALAQIPFAPIITEEVGDRTQRRKMREHFTYPLVSKRPHPLVSAHNFIKVMQGWAVMHDDAYAVIERNGNAQVSSMFPIHPKRVKPKIVKKNGRQHFLYVIDGEHVLNHMSVLHIVGNTDNGLTGNSRIGVGREGIGKAIAARDFGAKYFGKGINVSGFIRTPKLLKDEDAVDRLKTSFARKYGGQNSQFGVGVLEDGAEWEQNETNPEEAQLNETEKVDARMAANFLVMPVTLLNQLERGTYSNVEQLMIQFVNHTLIPWGNNWEQECWYKLLTEREKRADNIQFKFNFNGLLRGDMDARSSFYEALAKVGALSPNDINELEDRNGYEGGDIHIVSPGATSVENIGQTDEQ